MSDVLRSRLIERLSASVRDDGGWGYSAQGTSSAEPTALAALALAAEHSSAEHISRALHWLAQRQLADGSVTPTAELDGPKWATALALLAWMNCDSEHSDNYQKAIDKATSWLLTMKGKALQPSIYFDHDVTMIGWPWVQGTHSWVEPTSYAICALRANGLAEHARVREGVKILLDRALPEGGWNYGNSRVFDNTLRPFPATTGVALAALAGEVTRDQVSNSIDYLVSELSRIRTPLSLSWGLIGLRAWNAAPPEAETWLQECVGLLERRPANPHYDALVLLAAAHSCPFIPASAEANHG